MACVIIQKVLATGYYVTGTGFQPVLGTGTTYSTKEAALQDAVTQREALGNAAILQILDLVTGATHDVPNFTN
jgi:hypothetical protein